MDYLRVMLLLAFTFILTVSASNPDRFTSCLPEGVKLTTQILESSAGAPAAKGKPKTLKSKLAELKARCKNRKLVTGKGKEIRIVQLLGCWGNPPEDYEEQLQRQERELKVLREKYVVIEIPCTPNKTIALGSQWSVVNGQLHRTYRTYSTYRY